MIPIDLIIYDLDGTLIDSSEDIADAVNAMLADLDLPPRTQAEIEGFIGDGIQDLVARSLGPNHLSLKAKALKLTKRHYEKYLLVKTHLYPDVLEVLEFFKTKKQTVLTNKPQRFTDAILAGLGVDSYFSKVIGTDSGFPKKPAPDAVYHLLSAYAIQPQKAVMVGDSRVDIETGKRAGILTCAVSHGFGKLDKRKEVKADFETENLSGLKTILT
ncbi:MAG: hypothetical protein COV74_01195 [Candidatus Omnitrophica bacterium CG11_big_fil_rev_8_21_14_0_20_45_26]|uniref:phosphoglycolate phosphatase n=1 Tax=Candidatus Abzuiibacterium crystallinum TaxID=1974748 RepID=A0A2H0LUI2_9BACT|nr:MAG: hypothetical protein COV74_01195 [Candidatus Omnitrophica bacterium CG11_big_fil_rev_8_21_14_0_20_45_26]PIW63482.1 MAG: phosphoglycolate phosphatase [Candidatus Omnitrophica bacterium CG12_big_fil_rev_8_21_14_0_65_45_16]